MLHVIGRGVDHAGKQQLVVGQLDLLPNRPLVGVARIGGLQRNALDLCAENDADDLAEIDVVGVRALVIAPADVHANLVRRYLGERVIEHVDVKRRALEKLGFGQILKAGMPGHGEIGTIELQDEACRNDGLVLFPHRVRDGLDIGLVGGVIAIGQKACDHARRGSRQKRLGWTGRIHGRAHVGKIAAQCVAILHLDRADADDALETLCPRQLRHLFAKVGKRRHVEVGLGRSRSSFVGKAGKPIVHVRRVADLAGFAIADDVDAGIDLPLDDIRYRLPNGPVETGLVVCGVGLARFEQL